MALQRLVQALLQGSDSTSAGPKLDKKVRQSLGYLQERIGVPRDMSYAAARQLRAHIGWLLRTSETAASAQTTATAPAGSATGLVYYDEGPEVPHPPSSTPPAPRTPPSSCALLAAA